MKSGQRDLHDNPPQRRLSISYEELETLHESIKASVLKELRAEMRDNPTQKSLKSHSLNLQALNPEALNQNSLNSRALKDSILSETRALNQNSLNSRVLKDSILSETRAELIGESTLSNSMSLKTSILNELRMELRGPSGAEQKLKEMKILQDGLLRELLDQKIVIKKLGEQLKQLSGKLEMLENKVPAVRPPPLDDSLSFPPLSRKQGAGLKKRTIPGRERVEVREVSAPLPGSSTKVKLKIEDEFPKSGVVEKPATKCEYIIAESGELKARQIPKGNSGRAENRKCEFIVAEQSSRPAKVNETVVLRDDEDVEIITCQRKILNTQ